MLPEPLTPTPYADVNAVLDEFATQIQAILGAHFRGMYLSGSLALGDFDPRSSDIDFVVLIDAPLAPDRVAALEDMHRRFAARSSPWAAKIEAVYIPPAALDPAASPAARYPQVEKDRPFFVDVLEDGWIFQCYILREHGVVVTGPALRPMIPPVDPDAMRRAAAPIAETWHDQAQHDPTWLDWLREPGHQAFVVLTLCRLLYTLDVGAVASKPGAARWAQQALGPRWTDLIARALAGQHPGAAAPEHDVADTVALIQYTVERFRQWSLVAPR